MDDLRPISILPSVSKVVEYILKDQNLLFLHRDLSHTQFAFRRGLNTTSLLVSLTDSIRDCINRDFGSVFVALDLSKSFNSVCYKTLIEKLKNNFNFSRSACVLINSYLRGRSQFVDVGGVFSNILPLCCGTQGSVLGPLLFIVYVNDLPLLMDTGVCKTYIFADDVFLLFSTHRDNCDVLESNINYGLSCFSQWTLANSLCVNYDKTKAIVFGNTEIDFNVSIDGQNIVFADNLKCLGVHIDNRLTFECHINHICRRIIGTLRKIYSNGIYLPCNITQQFLETVSN